MNLIELLKEDDFHFEMKASTNEGEFKGPCPFCGGEDRFCVWPNNSERGRYWCRQCKRSGDAVEYLTEYRKISRREALDQLELLEERNEFVKNHNRISRWLPRKANKPNEIWQNAAEECVSSAESNLWSTAIACKYARRWLQNRGLSNSTIKRFRLGWISENLYIGREKWGLIEKEIAGNQKPLWIPAGLLIPCIRKNKIARLRVRRSEPVNGRKYVIVTGSNMSPLLLNTNASILFVVESELDGLILNQEIGEAGGIIALGSVSIRPDQETHGILTRADKILIALDSDKAGAMETRRWWLSQYDIAEWWPIPLEYGKDPSEAYKKGLDLNAWAEAGMFSIQDSLARPQLEEDDTTDIDTILAQSEAEDIADDVIEGKSIDELLDQID